MQGKMGKLGGGSATGTSVPKRTTLAHGVKTVWRRGKEGERVVDGANKSSLIFVGGGSR